MAVRRVVPAGTVSAAIQVLTASWPASARASAVRT